MKTIKKISKRAEDLSPEESERIRRDLTKNAKEVKTQMTLKEISKLKKQGIVFGPRGVVIEGENKIKLGEGIGYRYK